MYLPIAFVMDESSGPLYHNCVRLLYNVISTVYCTYFYTFFFCKQKQCVEYQWLPSQLAPAVQARATKLAAV